MRSTTRRVWEASTHRTVDITLSACTIIFLPPYFFSGTSLPASSPDFMNGDSNFWVLVPKTAIVVYPLMEFFFLHLTDACEMMIRITKLGHPPKIAHFSFASIFFLFFFVFV